MNGAQSVRQVVGPSRASQCDELEQVAAIRRLHCRWYDDCLDVAAAREWPGFSCEGCTGYVRLSPDGELRDFYALLRMAVGWEQENPESDDDEVIEQRR